jgi:hypothetical protein
VVATVAIDVASLVFGLPLRQLAAGVSLIGALVSTPRFAHPQRLSPG